jgi:hypothetical protein
MKEENKIDVEGIIKSMSLSTDISKYNGNGVNLSDLDSGHLKKAYNLVKLYYGLSAADEFVKMVDGIPYLSAPAFIDSFRSLADNGWVYNKNRRNMHKYKVNPGDGFSTSILKDSFHCMINSYISFI